MTWLLILILVPLAGSLVLAFLKGNDRAAVLAALGFSILEFVLVIPFWLSYSPSGARLQMTSSFDWIPSFGVHISFGVDGIVTLDMMWQIGATFVQSDGKLLVVGTGETGHRIVRVAM